MRTHIHTIISALTPHDGLEEKHIQETLSWIESDAPIFRIAKPDVPNKHLVSYFALLDEDASKILLVDHKKAQLWLPAGGHVDVDEDPKKTVIRECFEELQIQADFWREDPIFLTSTVTGGLTPGHTDVSLWYVLRGNHKDHYAFDPGEFHGIAWFDFDQIPYENSDPHLARFVEKLKAMM